MEDRPESSAVVRVGLQGVPRHPAAPQKVVIDEQETKALKQSYILCLVFS